jgi:hypothetical protein
MMRSSRGVPEVISRVARGISPKAQSPTMYSGRRQRGFFETLARLRFFFEAGRFLVPLTFDDLPDPFLPATSTMKVSAADTLSLAALSARDTESPDFFNWP